jgi:hypothetical protein
MGKSGVSGSKIKILIGIFGCQRGYPFVGYARGERLPKSSHYFPLTGPGLSSLLGAGNMCDYIDKQT